MPWEPWTELTSNRGPRRPYRRWTENGLTRVIQWDNENGLYTDSSNNQISRSDAERLTTPRIIYSSMPAAQISRDVPSRSAPQQVSQSGGRYEYSQPSANRDVRARSPPTARYTSLIPVKTADDAATLRDRGSAAADRYVPTSGEQTGRLFSKPDQREGVISSDTRRAVSAQPEPLSNSPPSRGPSISDTIEFNAKKRAISNLIEPPSKQQKSEKKLNDAYRIYPAHSFTPGGVFAVLWAENEGHLIDPTSRTIQSKDDRQVTRDKIFGEPVHSEIRRMVIFKAYKAHSLCVSINTYGGQGCLKRGLTPEEIKQHAVAHQSDAQPLPHADEARRGMNKAPIAIVMTPGERLNKWSRVRFDKVYCLEHNFKVKKVGVVSKKCQYLIPVYLRQGMGLDD